MKTPRDDIARHLHSGAVVAGVAVGLVGLIVLSGGWWLNIEVLRQPLPPYTAIGPYAAFGLVVCGFGVLSAGLRWSPWVTGAAGVAATALGVLACAGAFLDLPPSSVERFITFGSPATLTAPARFSPDAALCLVLAGTALLLLAVSRADGVRQALGVGVGLIGYTGVLGYAAFAAKAGEHSPGPMELALHNALPLMLLGFGLVFVSLDRGWGRIFAEPLAGGRVVRIFLPVMLVVLLVAAVMYAWIEDVSGPDVSAGAVVIAGIALAVTVGLLVVASRLQRIDQERLGLATDIEARITTQTLDLQQATNLLRAQFDGAPNGVALAGVGGQLLDVNRALCEILGYTRSELLATDLDSLTEPEDLELSRAFTAAMLDGQTPHHADIRHRHRDGHRVWIRRSVGIVRDERGDPLVLVCQFEDITSQVLDRQALADSEQLFRLTMDHAPQGMALVRLDLTFLQVNPALCRMLGRDQEWLLSHTVRDVIHADDLDHCLASMDRLLAGASQAEVHEGRWRRADGTSLWVVHATGLLRDERNNPLHYVSHVQDNSDAHRAGQELARRARTDPLTGLINREQLQAHVTQLLGLRPREDRGPALLFCDIDHFKRINDTYGHEAGDAVLLAIARRIASSLRAGDVVGRLGGDEFVVVLSQIPDQAVAVAVAEKIRSAVNMPLPIGAERSIRVTLSVGVVLFTPAVDAHRLLRNADAALYEAKHAGRDQVAVFDDPGTARTAIDIREGLTAGRFVPWFQPIVRLEDEVLVGYEALARWVRPDGRVVLPNRFLPETERARLVNDLDLTLMEQSIERLGALPAPLFVAVNVSGATLSASGYADRLIQALKRAGVDPSRLHLEFTETAMLTASENVRGVMRDLADTGARWYVDDFGTGYSSIAHLRDLPTAGLKLDRSFTAGLGSEDPTCERLAAALVGLAAGLGLDTVAEGVETPAQAALLREQGWAHGQGWLYGHPHQEPATR